MSKLALIRHGRTEWNKAGKLTGRMDIGLTNIGRKEVAEYYIPEVWRNAFWHVSPLFRARETAELLGFSDAFVDDRLVEMDFGDYEGYTVSELRGSLGREMTDNENRGLDFQPPKGESPRIVQSRLRSFLQDIGRGGELHVAVVHKTVIRCILASAYGWEMIGKAPVKLRWDCMHVFAVDADATVTPIEMNISLINLS